MANQDLLNPMSNLNLIDQHIALTYKETDPLFVILKQMTREIGKTQKQTLQLTEATNRHTESLKSLQNLLADMDQKLSKIITSLKDLTQGKRPEKNKALMDIGRQMADLEFRLTRVEELSGISQISQP